MYGAAGCWADLNVRLAYNRYEYVGDYPLDNDGERALNRDVTVAEWIDSDLFAVDVFPL